VIKNGQFTSVWEHGQIMTTGTIDTETYEVKAKKVESPDLGCLIEEIFETNDGDLFNICCECHEFAISEDKCKNPNCDSNKKHYGHCNEEN
jgi:hypothetical protein